MTLDILQTDDPSKLTNKELLKVLFGNAHRLVKEEAEATASDILKAYNEDITLLCNRDPKDYQFTGKADRRHARVLAAAVELAKRLQFAEKEEPTRLFNPDSVYRAVAPMIAHDHREIFLLLTLSTSGRLIQAHRMTEGTLSASLVDTKAIFRTAILDHAASIIVVHNHPSGKLDPSKEDIQITKDIAHAGDFMDLPLHDHLIVGPTGYASMKNAGYV